MNKDANLIELMDTAILTSGYVYTNRGVEEVKGIEINVLELVNQRKLALKNIADADKVVQTVMRALDDLGIDTGTAQATKPEDVS